MPVAVPECWAGYGYEEYRWYRKHAPEYYKVEVFDGVLTLSLRTRADRALIALLTDTLGLPAAEHQPGMLIATSLRQSVPEPAPGDDRRLRRHTLFHEAATTMIRKELERGLADAGLADRYCVLLGPGWQPKAGEPPFWMDVCVLAWHALVCSTAERTDWTSLPAPELIVEVLEPPTAEFDRTERRRAYAAGGCRRLLFADPADPERDRCQTEFELWDLTDPRASAPARRGVDRIRLDPLLPIAVDLASLSALARAVVQARDADDL
jgi:hypothetical protein